jgi:predicted dehydrogenase
MAAPRPSIGLVGCGAWGANILRDLLGLGCDVRVVTRGSASARRALALGAAQAGTDPALLEGCQGVVVATPTATHAAVLTSVLPLGVPVFCEKPLTCDPDAARRIVGEAGDRVFVMDKWRYHPGILELARIARDGELGETHGLRTVRVQRGNPHVDVDCLWTLLPHDLSIALEVLGSVPWPEAAVAHREGGSVTGLIGQLRVEDGPWVTVDVASNAPAHVRRVELHGSNGVAALADGWDEEITVATTAPSGDRRVRTIPTPGELPLLAELRAFVGYLDGGPQPRSSAVEGLRVVEAIADLRRLAGLER